MKESTATKLGLESRFAHPPARQDDKRRQLPEQRAPCSHAPSYLGPSLKPPSRQRWNRSNQFHSWLSSLSFLSSTLCNPTLLHTAAMGERPRQDVGTSSHHPRGDGFGATLLARYPRGPPRPALETVFPQEEFRSSGFCARERLLEFHLTTS